MVSRRLYSLAFAACCVLTPPAWSATLTGGPMPGHATSRTASLWLQADGPGELQIEYWPEGDPRVRGLSAPTRLGEATDYSARVELQGLRPDAFYRYAVYLDGQRVRDGADLRLRTLPARGESVPEADFTVYLGGGARLGDAEATGGGAILASLAAAASGEAKPNLMLWLGDGVLLSEADSESPWAMNARYRAARSLAAPQSLLRATRHYAVWNDDYGAAGGNRAFEFKDASAALFQRYWANPGYGLAELPGTFTRFGLLDADFFLLDGRSYRASDRTVEPEGQVSWWQELKDLAIGSNQWSRLLGRRYLNGGPAWLGENKTLFGAAQLDWLKQSLIASRATFKVVVSGDPLFNDANTGAGWQNFRGEREAFVEWLGRQGIEGVLFVSGGRRHTELLRRERKDAYPLHELGCAPLAGPAALPEAERENPQRVPGTLVERRNYCTLEAIGRNDGRALRLRARDEAGRVLWERTLSARDLKPRAAP